jgi:hypothetical protein
MNLHEQHRPPELGHGTGSYPVWYISKEDLGSLLIYQETSNSHGRIAPARTMSLPEYENALAATRERWIRVLG